MKIKNLIIALALIAILPFGLFAGCKGATNNAVAPSKNEAEQETEEQNGNNEEEQSEDEDEQGKEEAVDAYKITFVVDEHVQVTVFDTQTLENGETQNFAYSRNKDNGELTKTDGQVNFVLTFDEGYELARIYNSNIDAYNNLKDVSTESVHAYRYTKITSNFTCSISSKETSAAENVSGAYKVTFASAKGIDGIYAYNTTALGEPLAEYSTFAYARLEEVGTIATDGSGQVNFVIIPKEHYFVSSVTASPDSNFANLKYINSKGKETDDISEAVSFRITKITGNITVTIRAR